MSPKLPAHERFRRSYFGKHIISVAERRVYAHRVEARTAEEQLDYERRHALEADCSHDLFKSGDGQALICRRCWGFRKVAA